MRQKFESTLDELKVCVIIDKSRRKVEGGATAAQIELNKELEAKVAEKKKRY